MKALAELEVGPLDVFRLGRRRHPQDVVMTLLAPELLRDVWHRQSECTQLEHRTGPVVRII